MFGLFVCIIFNFLFQYSKKVHKNDFFSVYKHATTLLLLFMQMLSTILTTNDCFHGVGDFSRQEFLTPYAGHFR